MGRRRDRRRVLRCAVLAVAVSAACSDPIAVEPSDRVVDAVPDDEVARTTDAVPDQSVVRPVSDAVGGVVRLSEVMYHAPLEDPADEYVELVNVGDRTVNLHEWCVSGAGFCFSEVVLIEPGAFVVVRQSEIEGTLSNGGERLELVDSLGQVVDAIDYDDESPWPTEADGGGASLHRLDHAAFDVDAWIAGAPTPGGPIQDVAPLEAGDVVITEVHYHPVDDDPAAAFVEVVNRSAASIDLDGWCVRGTSYCWGPGSALAAGQAAATTGVLAAGELSRSGERLRIVDPNGRIHDTVVYEDHGDWPAVADGHGSSIHRRNPTLSGEFPGNWEPGPPTPGDAVVDTVAELLPMFSDVEFTIAPADSESIGVSATIDVAVPVSLAYVVDFGPEVEIAAVSDDDGRVTVSIPPQPAGSLVRFRLIAATDDGTLGVWPRSGDGMRYAGTVVADPEAGATALPRLQWFMPEAVWAVARTDRDLGGDDGYPVVVALDGRVFDGATVRIKGNQARYNTKKKWKVMLPAGHHWDGGGLFRQPIDQFDLLPAATDKSFSREALVADLQLLSGGIAQQVVPLRLELNGQFLGLYLYGESPDGDWRDLMGFGPDVYVWKAELVSKLRTGDLRYSDAEFARHYERVTNGWLDDGDALLRGLISTVDGLTGDAAVAWAYEHVDVPQVVEALATMRIVQHSEWQHKNYYVMFDPADERWRLVPIDFDLTFGRWYAAPCNARCDAIVAQPYLEYPGENRLAAIFLDNEPFRSMVDRRTRELAEVYLAEGYLERRLDELLVAMESDAALDRQRWGAYGEWQSMEMAQDAIVRSYLQKKRRLYIGPDSLLPDPQPADPSIDVVDVVTGSEGEVVAARIVNREDVAIDVSNRTFDEIGAVLPAGVVLPAGGSVTVVIDEPAVARPGTPVLLVSATRME
ncbi:MAG: lamin tail domain-containing protein [Ilumatobacteraceae bacterium]